MNYRRFLSTSLLLIAAAVTAFGQDKIGKIQQGLVGGKEVDEKVQEAYGLLKFRMGGGICSASLLRNDWAISAAHCVDQKDAMGRTMPDPSRPGQNILRPLGPMNLIAGWGGVQTKNVTSIVTFWPYDVALIKLDSPVEVNGKTTGYVREVFFDQFPLFGTPVTANLIVFGAGINQFATGSGATATPSSSDDKFRRGTARVEREEGTLYWYPAGDNMIAGGDSGGPSFTTVGTNRTTVLVGVHALTLTNSVAGKRNEPGWTWVTSTPEAADAPIKPVWKQIEKIMGPVVIVPTTPEPSTDRHKAVFEEGGFPTGGGKVEDNILYGVQQDGQLIWHRHFIDRRDGGVRHSFQPTKKVGDGWKGGYQGAYPAGANAIYSLDDEGNLHWQWHTGVFDGKYRWGAQSQIVATGWSKLKILPMDNGVVYTMNKSDLRGILRWHRHKNYLNGQDGESGWEESKDVNQGFGQYINMFSGGNGVIYAVGLDGQLYWYRHKEYLKPPQLPSTLPSNLPAKVKDMLTAQWPRSWEGPKKIGDGWNTFTKIFSPGGGHIYAITADGDLMYYRHLGVMDGSYRWDETVKGKLAGGWNGYAFAFARIITSDPEPELPK